MSNFQLTLLAQTYNTLMTISTKGKDTCAMAECLKTLKSLYEELNEELEKKESNNIESEE